MSDLEDAESRLNAALVYPTQCSALRKNGLVMIKGKACRIVEMSTSKAGKHGHAKVHMVAVDIFVMDDTGNKREDLKSNDPELEKEIREKFEAGECFIVCVLSAIGRDMIVGFKNMVK